MQALKVGFWPISAERGHRTVAAASAYWQSLIEIRISEQLIHDVMQFKLVAAPVLDAPVGLECFKLPPIFDI